MQQNPISQLFQQAKTDRILREKLRFLVQQLLFPKISSRLNLFLYISVAAMAGYGTNMLLLKIGVHKMWVRYLIALCAAYGSFLLVLPIWLKLILRDAKKYALIEQTVLKMMQSEEVLNTLLPSVKENLTMLTFLKDVDIKTIKSFFDKGNEKKTKGNKSSSVFDFDLFEGFEEGGAILFFIILALCAVFIFSSALLGFGVSFVLVDIIVSSVAAAGLGFNLHRISYSDLRDNVFCHTWKIFVFLVVMYGVVAFLVQDSYPQCRSLGEFFKIITR